MAAQMITPITSFNANTDMGYTKARVNSNGGKSVGIIHNDTKKQLHVSVPLMLTWESMFVRMRARAASLVVTTVPSSR